MRRTIPLVNLFACVALHVSLGKLKLLVTLSLEGLAGLLSILPIIFLKELANLEATRQIITSLVEVRATADRVDELSALINVKREVKTQASLAHEKE